jgi:hypothetical protein
LGLRMGVDHDGIRAKEYGNRLSVGHGMSVPGFRQIEKRMNSDVGRDGGDMPRWRSYRELDDAMSCEMHTIG